MKSILALLSILLITVNVFGQTNPKIGTEKGVKEKLLRIKNGLPDMKKNLTVKDADWADSYNVKFEMGNGIILFDNHEDRGEQVMTISFDNSYFSGTIPDFQNYYKSLVTMLSEILGNKYISEKNEKAKEWSAIFYPIGYSLFETPVSFTVNCNWMIESIGPTITIEIVSRLKP